MNLNSKKEIKNLFKKHSIYPSKDLGQNFLIKEKVFLDILKCSDILKKDTIIEIGPGIGNLTRFLSEKAKRVIAIEKDKKMIEILEETLKDKKNVQLFKKDILKTKISRFDLKNYKVVANLPYYITSPIIRKFLEERKKPEILVLMLQKEVAQRICASPPNMSILSVSVQFYGKPEIFSYVSKESFWPSPKVESAILKIIPQKERKVDSDLFFKIVKTGFSHPRKQLVNNLLALPFNDDSIKLNKEKIKGWLLKNNIQPERRAESLNVEDWIKLTKTFKNNL